MDPLPRIGDPSVARLEHQVRLDVERLRSRLADGAAPPPQVRGRRKTGRLYQVISSCLGDANFEG